LRRLVAVTTLVGSASIVGAQGSPGSPAQSQDALHTISDPGGGEIVYGTLSGQSSLANAMIFMLRQVHGHFGERPQIGKFFQSRGGDSVATFFTLSAKNQGNKAIAGLVIVNMPRGATPSAAVLYDDATHFTRTEPAMLRKLNQAMHTSSGPSEPTAARDTPATPARMPAPQELRMSSGGDHSAGIGLAPGWRLTAVSGGMLTAEGPSGEMISLGLIYQGIRDPRSMQTQQLPYGANGGAQRAVVCPYGGEVFQAYTCVINQMRQNKGLPQASFRLSSSQRLPSNQQEQQVIQAIFEMDLHDGKGPRKASARIGEMHVANLPSWALTVNGSNAPEAVFDQVNPTIMAMVHSFSVDQAVIQRQTAAVIDNIHAIGAASAAQAKAADQRREASSAAFNNHISAINQSSGELNSHMDDIDRSSKAFQDYTLDRSVVRDTNLSERATVNNSYADSLVRANPERFEIVPNQNLIRGLDY
ncbi:MAG TPA: hypothetical protein VII41_02310, partial [Steroidobacteraceae bacterium]